MVVNLEDWTVPGEEIVNLGDWAIPDEEIWQAIAPAWPREGAVRLRGYFFPPVPCREAISWHRVGPHALIVMMLLNRWRVMGGREPFAIRGPVLDSLRIESRTCDRVLAALQRAGHVRVERRRGRLPKIWLIDKPQHGG
jgi:hypothetical protein